MPSNASNTIFQVWTDSSKVQAVTAAHYRAIASPSNYWYLNNAANTWKVMYSYDPCTGLTEDQATYIIGDEINVNCCVLWVCVYVCMYCDVNNCLAMQEGRRLCGASMWMRPTWSRPSIREHRLSQKGCGAVPPPRWTWPTPSAAFSSSAAGWEPEEWHPALSNQDSAMWRTCDHSHTMNGHRDWS